MRPEYCPYCENSSLFLFVVVFSEEVDDVAKKLKLKLFRTSAKENFNVDKGASIVVSEK